MKKVLFALVLILLGMKVSFAETNIGQEIGRGLKVGGVANGSPLGWSIAAVGSIVDFVSGSFGSKSLDGESPEYKANLEKTYIMQIEFACRSQFKDYLKPTSKTSLNEIQTKADTFCEDIDKIISEKGYLQINRSFFAKMPIVKDILPPGEGDIISYKLTKNPINDCTNNLYEAGKRMVARAKKDGQ